MDIGFKSEDYYNKMKCRNYGKNGKPVACPHDKNCKFLHITSKDFYRQKHAFRYKKFIHEYDEIIKNFDHNNLKLMNEGRIATFNLDTKQVSPCIIKSAGVIPYTVVNGKVLLLVGYEKMKYKAYRFFGGMRDLDYDKNCIVSAVREFCEESYGIFHKDWDIEEAMGKYIKLCNDKNFQLFNRYHFEGRYIMFLLPIPYFNLKLLNDALKMHRKNPNEFFTQEKVDYAWVSWSDALKGKPIIGGLKRVKGKLYNFDFQMLKLFRQEPFKAILRTWKPMEKVVDKFKKKRNKGKFKNKGKEKKRKEKQIKKFNDDHDHDSDTDSDSEESDDSEETMNELKKFKVKLIEKDKMINELISQNKKLTKKISKCQNEMKNIILNSNNNITKDEVLALKKEIELLRQQNEKGKVPKGGFISKIEMKLQDEVLSLKKLLKKKEIEMEDMKKKMGDMIQSEPSTQ